MTELLNELFKGRCSGQKRGGHYVSQVRDKKADLVCLLFSFSFPQPGGVCVRVEGHVCTSSVCVGLDRFCSYFHLLSH